MRGSNVFTFVFIALLVALTFPTSGYTQRNFIISAPDLLPVTGIPVPELVAYDQAVQQFMGDRSITAGALAVMKDGVIVLEHGYGWRDQAAQIPLSYNALFRWASIIKPVTAATIKKLVTAGQLSTSDKVFCLPESVGTCRLNIPPFGTPDLRLKDITIQHLLDHQGGWDRSVAPYDPMFRSLYIANVLGISSPPSQVDTVRYMMGQPLAFDPGSKTVYSNFGYLLLGLIIEQVTGSDYTSYIQNTIFNPLGVPDSEVELGRTLPQNRNPREPRYACPTCSYALNVFNPLQYVPWPDGGWYLEAMESHGGMIGSTRAMAKFLQAYWISGEPRTGNGQTWIFYGSLDGTWTLAYQRPDGVNLVALFNQRNDPSGLSYYTIQNLLDTATVSIVTWPTEEPVWPYQVFLPLSQR